MLALGAYELLKLFVQLLDCILSEAASVVQQRELFFKGICSGDSDPSPIEELYRLIIILLKSNCAKSLLLYMLELLPSTDEYAYIPL